MYGIFTYIYHPSKSTKCRYIYHTWILWEIKCSSDLDTARSIEDFGEYLGSLFHKSKKIALASSKNVMEAPKAASFAKFQTLASL